MGCRMNDQTLYQHFIRGLFVHVYVAIQAIYSDQNNRFPCQPPPHNFEKYCVNQRKKSAKKFKLN